jgi:hypothetical protein
MCKSSVKLRQRIPHGGPIMIKTLPVMGHLPLFMTWRTFSHILISLNGGRQVHNLQPNLDHFWNVSTIQRLSIHGATQAFKIFRNSQSNKSNPIQYNKRYKEIRCPVRSSVSLYYNDRSGATQWRSWLSHCATSRKVATSIPIGIFHWHNHSSRNMALGSTHSLTE